MALRVAMQLPGTEAVKKAVEAGLGIAFVSQYAVERERALGALKVVPVDGLKLIRSIDLVYRKNKIFSPVAQRFREVAHAYAREHLTLPGAVRGGAKGVSRTARAGTMVLARQQASLPRGVPRPAKSS